MDTLAEAGGFSGVVSLHTGDAPTFERAYGLADRSARIPNTATTRFGLASGAKGFSALTVMSLVEDGHLTLATSARTLLGTDLPLIDDGVTVEHLLAHRSGIGDYVDEDLTEDLDVWPFPIPPTALETTAGYLAVLDGHPQKFAPGSQFSYCNGGFVVLALMCERATGIAFPDLVSTRVCAPADLTSTAFLAVNALPPDAAVGYLDDGRPNTENIPTQGSGDGGIFSTAGDLARFWHAVFRGAVVTPESFATMVRPVSDAPAESKRYGLGFWLHPTTDTVMLEGLDAGVSFRSIHDPHRDLTVTVIGNDAYGVWPIARHLEEVLEL